jgi:hypothetical protein
MNLGIVHQNWGICRKREGLYERAVSLDPAQSGKVEPGAGVGTVRRSRRRQQMYGACWRPIPSGRGALPAGYLRLQRGDFRGSVEAFERCLAKNPSWSEAR